MIKKRFAWAAAILLPIGAAAADNPPDVKEGLWSIRTQSIQNPGGKKNEQKSTICRNHAYDQYVLARAKNVKGCTTVNESSSSGKHSVEMHCVIEKTAIETKGTTTFQGDTVVHSETHATYNPPLSGMSDITTIQDQKYIGACAAGTEPGDIISENGSVSHTWKH